MARKIKGHATLAGAVRGLISTTDRLARYMADAATRKGAEEHPQDAELPRVFH